MMVSAGLLAVDLGPLYAQSQSQQSKTGASQSQNPSQGISQNKNKPGTHTGHQGSDATMKSASAANMFVKKAAESNMAEIELSRLALQQTSSQQVKDYAQQMIDHHTMAQQELASLVSGSASMDGRRSDNDASMDDSNSGSGNTSTSPNVSGGTTGSGSTYSSGNASGAAGTQDNVSGQSSNATTTGKQGNSSGSNEPNAANNDASNNTGGTTGGTKSGLGAGSTYESSSTGGGGAGANSGGTNSSTGLGAGSGAGTGDTDARRPSGVNNGNREISDEKGIAIKSTGPSTTGDPANSADNIGNGSSATSSTDATAGMTMYGDLPTQLSAEHQALHTKLSKLKGAEFDRQYIQVMVKDHAKAVELFEKQAKSSDDAALQGYASKNLPLIKQHHQMAQKLSASTGSSKGSSDSK